MPLIPNTILTSWRYEVGQAADVTIDIGTDPGDDNYGPAILVNDNPAQVAKIDSTSGAWVLSSDTKMPVRLAALLHHNLDAGLDVVLQGSNGGSPFGAQYEVAFTIPPHEATGTRKWPVQPFIDLQYTSPNLGDYDPLGFFDWRLYVRGTNSENLQVGGLKLYSQIQTLTYDFREGWNRTIRKPIIKHTTAFLVSTKYTRMTAQWACDGSLLVPTSQLEELDNQFFDVDGESLPFIVVPNGLKNRCYFVTRADGIQRESVRYYTTSDESSSSPDDDLPGTEWVEYPLALTEVGRGLRPGAAVA